MNTKSSFAIFSFALLITLFAGKVEAQKVGTTSLQFLKVMPTARATAMGDAFTALAWGADAIFWNPAGVAGVPTHELTTSLTLWLFDTKQSAIGYALSLGDWGHAGVQLQFVDYGEIEETRVDQLAFVGSGSEVRYNPGLTGRTFSPMSWVAGISYAKQLTDRFSTGLSAKYVYESLWRERNATVLNTNGAPESYNTFTQAVLFDFGMHYDTGYRSTRLGVSVQNFGPQVQFAKEEYPAPLIFRLGVASNIVGESALLFPDEKNRLTLAYDLVHPNDYDQQMHFGAEYVFANAFTLRSGYKLNYDAERWTFGLGARAGKLNFDYSYGDLGNFLGEVHRLTLGIRLK